MKYRVMRPFMSCDKDTFGQKFPLNKEFDGSALSEKYLNDLVRIKFVAPIGVVKREAEAPKEVFVEAEVIARVDGQPVVAPGSLADLPPGSSEKFQIKDQVETSEVVTTIDPAGLRKGPVAPPEGQQGEVVAKVAAPQSKAKEKATEAQGKAKEWKQRVPPAEKAAKKAEPKAKAAKKSPKKK